MIRDTRWRSWLRHCATSRKVAVSIPNGGIRMERSSILILLARCQQTCMTYAIAVCTVKNS